MKRIIKDEPPESFDRWKKNTQHGNQWDAIHNQPCKQVLVAALRREQGNLCCYCERQLKDGKTEVEHFREKSNHPKQTFDYENLHASCNGGSDRACCNQKRQNKSYEKMLSPLAEDVEQRFTYDTQGYMKPADPKDEIALSTIEILGLNCQKLVRHRREVYRTLKERQNMNSAVFGKLINERLARNDDGHFSEFWTVVDFFFGSRSNL